MTLTVSCCYKFTKRDFVWTLSHKKLQSRIKKDKEQRMTKSHTRSQKFISNPILWLIFYFILMLVCFFFRCSLLPIFYRKWTAQFHCSRTEIRTILIQKWKQSDIKRYVLDAWSQCNFMAHFLYAFVIICRILYLENFQDDENNGFAISHYLRLEEISMGIVLNVLYIRNGLGHNEMFFRFDDDRERKRKKSNEHIK